MAPRILVVDSDEAFATMLKELLEVEGGYAVEVARTGRDALDRLRSREFALTIVDMGLAPGGTACLELIQSVRRAWPAMRLMVIPFMGAELPVEMRRLDVQGTLSKPFFADDLLPAIKEALSRPVKPPAAAPRAAAPARASAPPPQPVERPAASGQPVLAELARETGAEAALLISTAPGQSVLAHASTLGGESVEKLAGLIVDAARSAQAAARFLGQNDAPFEHNMFESSTLRLYVMALPPGRLLAVVTPVSVPLGTVRQNLRRACRQLGT